MAKKFSEEERSWVGQKLLTEGRRLFESYGLKKTSVEELTQAVGIAQGSFYLFYSSKEELFYALMQEDEKRIRAEMQNSFAKGEMITKEGIKRFLIKSFQMLEQSPLLQGMIVKRELEQLMRKLPKELLARNFSEDQDAMMPIISLWQSAGIMKGVAPELLVSLFRSLILLRLHKEEIGEGQFDATMELLIDVIATGLVTWSAESEGANTDDRG
ncbi:TetR/AcrR family transcriptional regulator [Paenibacillus sp. L3-i20]|uniref:TetR/AcrR family transcriptional regulator n=1 Tax=Paenibacillus sp. L3-i20 TaxID=2905833 RepID=UPI001EDFFF9E|nr:TetR/AcrR family transcriptional regulator [Paenibacillus sp. L3-i20]GKU76366.1 TetR family transcriptional regulator [Paenibacillus sp. L3-i20]